VTASDANNCAPVPLSAEYWHAATPATALAATNNLLGALVLSADFNEHALGAQFTTEFAEPQDLTQHSVLSFNLFKQVAPAFVFVSIETPHGIYRTASAKLFEQINTITVDLASSEFSVDVAGTSEFDEPIIGLSAVKKLSVHLVAVELAKAQVTLDSMIVCSAASSAPVAEATAIVEFPDIASLSTALTTALGEVQRLAEEVGELRSAQRRARRSFDEFSSSVRETLDSAVASLGAAMTANVDQTVTNSKLLQRLRERLTEAATTHDERIAKLDAQYEALRSLSLKNGESLADGVQRVNAEEKAEEQATLQKRSTLLADAKINIEERIAAKTPIVGESFGLNLKKAPAAKLAAVPLVRAPLK